VGHYANARSICHFLRVPFRLPKYPGIVGRSRRGTGKANLETSDANATVKARFTPIHNAIFTKLRCNDSVFERKAFDDVAKKSTGKRPWIGSNVVCPSLSLSADYIHYRVGTQVSQVASATTCDCPVATLGDLGSRRSLVSL
jgi:hypothetical protein